MKCDDDKPLGLVIASEPTAVERSRQLLRESGGPEMELLHAATLDEGLTQLGNDQVQLVLLNANVAGGDRLRTYLSVLDRSRGLPVAVWSDEDQRSIPLQVVQIANPELLLSNLAAADRTALPPRPRAQVNSEPADIGPVDGLTGFPNRAAFLAELETAQSEMLRDGDSLSSCFLT